jgi:hypothetical protein
MSDEIIEDPGRLYTPDEIFDHARAYTDTHDGQRFRVSMFAMWTSYVSIEQPGYFEDNNWKDRVEADAKKKGLRVAWGSDTIFLFKGGTVEPLG